MLKAQAYDLVLTGEETSGKQDVELLRQIRTVRPHVRLIIITSKSTPADVIAAMRERAFSYFSEPHPMEAFERVPPSIDNRSRLGRRHRDSFRHAAVYSTGCPL